MVKRASGGGVPNTPKRRLKADPVLSAIVPIVMEAEHLPDSCRAMLRDMLPFSLAIHSDKRHESQTWVVNAVEEILNTRKVALAQAVLAEEQKLASVKNSEAELIAVVKSTEAALDAQTTAFSASVATLTAATEAMESSEKVLHDAQTEHEAGDAKLKSASEDKAALELAFEAHFKGPMAEGKGPHWGKLRSLLKKINMDASLFDALPGSCAKSKEARGSFDDVVLQELEKELTTEMASLSDTVRVETPASVTRKAALEAAVKDHSVKKEAHGQASEAREVAEKKQAELSASVNKAQDAVKEYQPQVDTATESLEEARASLGELETGPFSGFTTYKNRVEVEVSPEIAPGGA